jgi:hypothetical protein
MTESAIVRNGQSIYVSPEINKVFTHSITSVVQPRTTNTWLVEEFDLKKCSINDLPRHGLGPHELYLFLQQETTTHYTKRHRALWTSDHCFITAENSLPFHEIYTLSQTARVIGGTGKSIRSPITVETFVQPQRCFPIITVRAALEHHDCHSARCHHVLSSVAQPGGVRNRMSIQFVVYATSHLAAQPTIDNIAHLLSTPTLLISCGSLLQYAALSVSNRDSLLEQRISNFCWSLLEYNVVLHAKKISDGSNDLVDWSNVIADNPAPTHFQYFFQQHRYALTKLSLENVVLSTTQTRDVVRQLLFSTKDSNSRHSNHILTSLSLAGCRFEDQGLALMEELANGIFPNFVKLELSRCRLSHPAMEKFIGIVHDQTVLPHLTTLELAEIHVPYSVDFVYLFFPSHHSSRNLVSINLSGVPLSDEQWYGICTALRNQHPICQNMSSPSNQLRHLGLNRTWFENPRRHDGRVIVPIKSPTFYVRRRMRSRALYNAIAANPFLALIDLAPFEIDPDFLASMETLLEVNRFRPIAIELTNNRAQVASNGDKSGKARDIIENTRGWKFARVVANSTQHLDVIYLLVTTNVDLFQQIRQ